LKHSQAWQIFPIYIFERSFGVHVVSIQRRGVIDEQSLRLGNCSKAVGRLLYGRNELIVVEGVFPFEVNKEWIWSLARLASSRGREG